MDEPDEYDLIYDIGGEKIKFQDMVGKTCLDFTRKELESWLGPPTDRSVKRKGREWVWKYGDIEYHFDENDKVYFVYTEVGPLRRPLTIAKRQYDPHVYLI